MPTLYKLDSDQVAIVGHKDTTIVVLPKNTDRYDFVRSLAEHTFYDTLDTIPIDIQKAIDHVECHKGFIVIFQKSDLTVDAFLDRFIIN